MQINISNSVFTASRFVGVLLMALVITGQTFSAEWKPLDLLGKRITVSMPAESKVEARVLNIMAAPESSQEEARVVYVEGNKKLVLMVWETFSLAGDDYEVQVDKRLKAHAKRDGTSLATTKPGKHVISGRPEKPNSNSDAIQYAISYFHNKDNSVLVIGIYFNPAFHKEPERCVKITDQILASLKQGDQSLPLNQTKKHFRIRSEELEMEVSFPEKYISTITVGPDFLVHRARKVVTFGSPTKTIGIYVGGHPSYHHRKIKEELLEKKTLKSPLFGEEQEWIQYSEKGSEEGRYVEIITRLPKIDRDMTHVFVSAVDEKGLQELLDIMKTAAIKKKIPPVETQKTLPRKQDG